MKARDPNNQTGKKEPGGTQNIIQRTFEENFKKPRKLSKKKSEVIAALK